MTAVSVRIFTTLLSHLVGTAARHGSKLDKNGSQLDRHIALLCNYECRELTEVGWNAIISKEEANYLDRGALIQLSSRRFCTARDLFTELA